MKCIQCEKVIGYFDKYEWHGCDGDFIHTDCKKDYEKKIDTICNMTNEEFYSWMGVPDLIGIEG